MINRSVLSRANRGAVRVRRKARNKRRKIMLDLSIFACVAAREMFRRKPDATSIRGDELPHKIRSAVGGNALPSRRIYEWDRDTTSLPRAFSQANDVIAKRPPFITETKPQ